MMYFQNLFLTQKSICISFVTNTIYFFFFEKNASEIRILKIAYYSNRVVVHFLESFAHIFVTLSIA